MKGLLIIVLLQVIIVILNYVIRGCLLFIVKKRVKIVREYFGIDEFKMKNVERFKKIDEEIFEKKMKVN